MSVESLFKIIALIFGMYILINLNVLNIVTFLIKCGPLIDALLIYAKIGFGVLAVLLLIQELLNVRIINDWLNKEEETL
jgi:uncharacterized paraquat-inducible protein A